MAIYELRHYTLRVGSLSEVINLYKEFGWPALSEGGFDAKLIGYFTTDTGTINALMLLWKFDDDKDRRAHWAAVFKSDAFMAFAGKLRPLIQKQEVQLLNSAPWGPKP